MEFLDEKAKRRRTQRLFLGYFLIAILVGLASLILVYLAQGYGYNPKNGVSQSGLLFVDAKPGAARITFDNQDKGDTAARFTIAEGDHTLKLTKDKYRDWTKSFTMEPGTVLYLVYPRLFPKEIPLNINQVYAASPAWASQSPDRRWLMTQPNVGTPLFNLSDLLDPEAQPNSFAPLTSQLAGSAGQYGTFAPIEWSDDNKHLLLLQTLPNGQKAYISINREDTEQTVNLTQKLKLDQTAELTLRDKKFDKFYVRIPATGALSRADTKSGIAPAFLVGVVDFKSYGDDLVLYATYQDAIEGQARILVNNKQKDTYQLQSVLREPSNQYLLDIARYEDNWYYVASSTTNKRVQIYINPLSRLKPNSSVIASAQRSLNLNNPQFVSFSDNARFISMQSGQQFVVYDAELLRTYRYTSPLAIQPKQEAKWMDGHRLNVTTDGKAHVFEFDGQNQQTLVASLPGLTAYFDRDYELVYSYVPQADGKVGLQYGRIVLE